MTRHRPKFVFAAVAISVVAVQAIAGKSIPIIPVQGKAVQVIVNGNEKNYYLLSKKTPLKLEIDGPGKLSVLSRLSFPIESPGSEKYSIRIMEGKKMVREYSTQTERSDALLKISNARLGKIRKSSLQIPDGSHTYELYLENTSSPEVAVKLSFLPIKGASKLVTLEALSYDRVVTAMVKEKLITYYVCSLERRVQLKVVGPTRMKVSARLNYDESMKGGQKFAIAMSESGKQIFLKPFATTKALGVTYREWKDVVPGKVSSFYCDVPKGEHTYKFSLEESVARSISLKFSIPQKDLDNEE